MLDPDRWITALRSRADRPPLHRREHLYALVDGAPVEIGSIEPALARRLRTAKLPLAQAPGGWCLVDETIDPTLAAIAAWLRDEKMASAWRDELLRVDDSNGRTVGAIERAAVRPLGIVTHAVHLVGRAEQGGVWVQQRALDKATDPGRWDTLMGGLIAADESIETALERETWEEAGLRLADLRDVRACGELTVRRPVDTGYMIEHIHMFEASIPGHLSPVNQDGEVAAFERLESPVLRDRLRTDAFTLEAALILIEVLGITGPG